ncbi:MAG: TRAP transporter large permease [Rhodospirillales bacterium]|nr:TRAP transporter large permease [Rhodospirillales bacterium]
MSGPELAVLMFAVLLGLIILRTPIAIAMFAVGAVGMAQLTSFEQLLIYLEAAPVGRTASYSLSVVPIFLLMGNLAMRSGLSSVLYAAARNWFGHKPGGIAVATIGGCAVFGAICGSSIATGATMASVALPEMRKLGYSGALSTGCLAAGGTLGILIPPSIILVIYAIITEQSIGDLFLAAIIPGVIATFYYIIAVWFYVRVKPESGPAGERYDWKERFHSLKFVWPVGVIFFIVIGGIYKGVFTPTEGAAIGAACTGIVALARKISWANFLECLIDTAKTTGMIFLILIAAEIYGSFMALSELPVLITETIIQAEMSPIWVVIVIMVIYILMGAVMDGLAMIIITVPLFLPVVMGFDIGLSEEALAIWFGILVLSVVETGLITPPVGINVYVINSMAEDVSLLETFAGVTPFVISDFFRLATIIGFPAVALWLPGLL